MNGTDSIVAISTPPGRGGIGIVRVSGPLAPQIAGKILRVVPGPGRIRHSDFLDIDGKAIDNGVAILFSAPRSYTGEHILELQGHGSPVVLQILVRRCLQLGARLARPGEFSERAFLNGRMDLAQAEAVADLIESGTESAARSAMVSLQGGFSERIHELVEAVTQLRIFVEAAIDFPDEEIDFLEDSNVVAQLETLSTRFESIKRSVQQGKILREGLKIVLTGLPNAGKSSLLNALTDEQRAIVSEIPGTTRDVLEQAIEIDGLPVYIIDTAGIRDTTNEIEAEGVRRAKLAQQQADLVVLVVDDFETGQDRIDQLLQEQAGAPTLLVRNKIDLSKRTAIDGENEASVSALTGQGLGALREKLKITAGYRDTENSPFLARQRHIDALERAENYLRSGLQQQRIHRAGELLADDLTSCQKALGEITGEISSDDLLGLIFGSFCIGK